MATDPRAVTLPTLSDAEPPASIEQRGVRRRAGWLRRHGWLWPALLVLIVMRAVLLHNDPADFPVDRNVNTAGKIRKLTVGLAWQPFGLEYVRYALNVSKEAPEFPFLPLGAWGLTHLRLPPVAAGRMISLLASVALAVGLYVLGRRVGPPLAGIVAVWLFALNPLAIHMGRGLLPDQVMTMALVLALVAAWRPQARARWLGAGAMLLFLVLAVLAKLPVLFFAPIVAVAWMQSAGWRGRFSWIAVLLAALATYLAACLWYQLDLMAPLAGVARLSENTNHALSGAFWTMLGPSLATVAINRMVLALTIPGLALALLGWFLVQARPGCRLWINLWFVFAMIFIILTIQANTYWVYPLTPLGCLLAGVAVAELCRRGRWTLVPLALALLIGGWLDPAVAEVRNYLAIHPEYRAIDEAAKRLVKGDNILYAGTVSGDIDYFVYRLGLTRPVLDAPTLARIKQGAYREVISNHMWGNDGIGELFFSKPILETRSGLYVFYHAGTDAHLGQPVAADALTSPTGVDLKLSDTLRIRSIHVRPAQVAPGDKLELDVIYEKGARYQPAPCLALDFVLDPYNLTVPLTPLSGGGSFGGWSRPAYLQTPEFTTGTLLARMRSTFEIPRHMPAGKYGLRFTLMKDCRLKAMLGEPQKVSEVLEVLPSKGSERLPLRIDPADCLWQAPIMRDGVPWLGRPRRLAQFGADSQVWIRPNLPPGVYELTLIGRAQPARVAADDVWPVLGLKKKGVPWLLPFRFTSEMRTCVRRVIRWSGPQDYLRLSLENPAVTSAPGGSFQLHLDGAMAGTRGVVLERVELRAAPKGRTPEEDEESKGS